MKAFHSRVQQQKNPFIYSWFIVAVLAFLLGLFVRGAYASFVKKSVADREEREYRERMEDLIEKKEKLETKIEKLETERGLEEEFRKRFNVVKEGETMIRIVK